MTAEGDARLAEVAGRLPGVVGAALGEPLAQVVSWESAALLGGFGALAGKSGVFRIAGRARVGAREQPWSVVLKVLAPVPEQDDPAAIYYWRREALLYRSGLLDALPPGLRAPRCHGCDERPDGSFWLWLEDVREDETGPWPRERWALAARHLGQTGGAYLDGRPLPVETWFGGGRLRSWLPRHERLIPLIARAPDDPAVSRWWPRPIVDAVLRLWAERETFLAAIERLPQTFGHGDAIRRNMLSRRTSDGAVETVGIDWEFAGHYAVGEEVGQTLSVASAFYAVDPAELPALDEALFAAYLAGLAEAGWRGDPRAVRLAYTAHAALRNGFNAVGTSWPDEARLAAIQANQGHSFAELAERRAEIRPFLLGLADEARALAGL